MFIDNMISITQFDNGQLTLLLWDFMPYSIFFNDIRMVKMRGGVGKYKKI